MKVALIIYSAIIMLMYGNTGTPQTRYFFVGYASSVGDVGGTLYITRDGKFVSMEEVKKFARTQLHDKTDESIQVIITAVYEFTKTNDLDEFIRDTKIAVNKK